MIVATSQVKHAKYSVPPSVLMYFLLPFFATHSSLVSCVCFQASRFCFLWLSSCWWLQRLCPLHQILFPWSVSFFRSMHMCVSVGLRGELTVIVSALVSEMCSPPVRLRSVLCQHHGDCWDVSRSHSHRPSVPSPQPQQWTNAPLGEFKYCHTYTH